MPAAMSGTRSPFGVRASPDRSSVTARRQGQGAPPTRSGRPAGRAAAWRTGRLAVHVEAEAVQEPVVDDRQAPLPQLAAPGLEPGPHRQAVLVGQGHGQVEDVVAPAVGQAVPVQVGRRQPGVDHRVDLRAELALDLVEASLGEQLGRGCP